MNVTDLEVGDIVKIKGVTTPVIAIAGNDILVYDTYGVEHWMKVNTCKCVLIRKWYDKGEKQNEY